MKKTQRIELFATIKNTLVSFISITMFVALAVAIFLGMSFSSVAFKNAIDDAGEEGYLHDYEISYVYGLNDEDLNKLKQIDGVDEVEGSHYVFAKFELDEVKYNTQVIQINKLIDLPDPYDGKLPEKIGEVAVKNDFAKKHDIKIGDTITLIPDNDGNARKLVKLLHTDTDEIDFENYDFDYEDDNKMAYLKTDTYKVVGFVESPLVISTDPNSETINPETLSSVDCFIYVSKDSFDEEAFDGYTSVLIRSDKLREYRTFTDEYKALSEQLKNEIKTKADQLVDEKNNTIKTKLNDLIKIFEEKLAEALAKIQDAEKQIEDGKKKIESAKKKINEITPQLEDGQKQVDSYKAQLAAGESEFNTAYGLYNKTINTANTTVETYNNEFENQKNLGKSDVEAAAIAGIEATDYAINSGVGDELISYAEAHTAQIEAGFKDVIQDLIDYCNAHDYVKVKELFNEVGNYINNFIALKQNEINNARYQIQQAQDKIDAGWAEVNNGKKLIKEYEKKIADGEIELANGKARYDDANKKFNENKEQLDNIEYYGSTTLIRKNNVTFIFTSNLSIIIDKLRYSLAALFVVVGLLVCYSAISRIVNDQIVAIGTKKALGLMQKEITLSFLLYTGFAVLIGCIIGVSAGVLIIENIIGSAFIKNFTVETFHVYYDLKTILIICAVEFVLLMLITYMACKSVLKQDAVKLLKGVEPPAGKQRFYEKFKVWNKFSLLTKTIVNNCVNDKKRVFATLVGVAGCTALIVTALTYKNNVLNSFKEQFDKYYHFDTYVQFAEGNEDVAKQIKTVLDEYGIDSCEITYYKALAQLEEGSYVYMPITVTDNIEDFKMFVTPEPTKSSQDKDPYEGVWIAHSYEIYYDGKIGDEVTVSSLTGEVNKFKIDGFFKHYLTTSNIIVDPKEYKEIYGHEHYNNCFMISTKDVDVRKLRSDMNKIDGFIGLNDYYNTSKNSFNAFESLSKVLVAVYMFLSVVMAVLVLLNLLTMFVDEKKRELIVLMINGFSIKEAKRYIYSDTILLTAIGIVIGTAFGCYMGNLSVAAFDTQASSFMRKIDWSACLIGAVGSAVMTFIICNIALSKIGKFKLTDINKV